MCPKYLQKVRYYFCCWFTTSFFSWFITHPDSSVLSLNFLLLRGKIFLRGQKTLFWVVLGGFDLTEGRFGLLWLVLGRFGWFRVLVSTARHVNKRVWNSQGSYFWVPFKSQSLNTKRSTFSEIAYLLLMEKIWNRNFGVFCGIGEGFFNLTSSNFA